MRKTSEKYRRIDSRELAEAIEGQVHLLGLDTSIQYKALSGSRDLVEITLPSLRTTDFGGLTPSIKFFNSYDGSSKARFRVGVSREVCSNKMTVMQTEFGAEITHIKGDATEEAIKQLPRIVANAIHYVKNDLLPHYAVLQQTKITKGEMARVISRLDLSDSIKGKALTAVFDETVRPTYDKDNSLFSLYNFINQFVRESGRSTINSCERVEETLLGDIVTLAQKVVA
jgi:hypothetical protein